MSTANQSKLYKKLLDDSAGEIQRYKKRLDDSVAEIYENMFSLPADQITSALSKHWARLASTCTQDEPCAECLREIESIRESDSNSES